jgi:hypothetical protein
MLILNYTPLANYSAGQNERFPLAAFWRRLIALPTGLLARFTSSVKKPNEIKIIETADGVIFLDTELPTFSLGQKSFEFLRTWLTKIRKLDQFIGKQLRQLERKARSINLKVSLEQKQQALSFLIGLLILVMSGYGLFIGYQKVKKTTWPKIVFFSLPEFKLPKIQLPKIGWSRSKQLAALVSPSPIIIVPTPTSVPKYLIALNQAVNNFNYLNTDKQKVVLVETAVTTNEPTLFYKPELLERAKAIATAMHQSVTLIEGDGFPQNADFLLIIP